MKSDCLGGFVETHYFRKSFMLKFRMNAAFRPTRPCHHKNRILNPIYSIYQQTSSLAGPLPDVCARMEGAFFPGISSKAGVTNIRSGYSPL